MPDGTWKKDFSPEWIRSACEASLKRLQTDYIDIYLYHTPRGEMAFIPEEFDVLRQLQQEGKIRHYGISVDTVADGMKTLAYPDNAEGIQVVYNILEREAELEFFPKARQLGVGIIARVPLASGFLTGKYTADVTFPPNDHRSRIPRDVIEQRVNQVEKLRELIADDDRTLAQLALQFCLAHPAVSTVIPGAKTPEQLADNARAGELPPLTDDERNRIRDLFPLKS
ncbi:MAG: aldo/keto reductase [Chloroflexi bacterium]|nr:MAG: aldo/keto reductase [Chloroflexota bacterium]